MAFRFSSDGQIVSGSDTTSETDVAMEELVLSVEGIDLDGGTAQAKGFDEINIMFRQDSGDAHIDYDDPDDGPGDYTVQTSQSDLEFL